MTVTCSRPSCGAAADDAETALALRWEHLPPDWWVCAECEARDAAAMAAPDAARRLIERTEADLPRLESRALEAAEALAAFDRELPAVTP